MSGQTEQEPKHGSKKDSAKQRKRNFFEKKFLLSFISGGIAGVVAKSAVAPVERVKLIFQTDHRTFTYRKGISLFKEIVKEEGVLSL